MSTRHGSRWQWHAYACIACGAAQLLGCIGDDLGTSRFLSERDESRSCIGAFTPNSKVCYDETAVEDGGVISTDNSLSEGFLDDVKGANRCQQVSIPVPGTPGSLTVGFTTTLLKGTYWPRNVGAAWIEDSMGQYVRTVEAWAGERFQSITMWAARACLTDPTVKAPDVITSATLDDHVTHTRTWDGKDFRGAVVPDGRYTLWLQVTESEFVPEGPYMMIPFEKGTQPWESLVPPEPGFVDIKLSYKPGAAMEPGSVKP